MMTGAGRVEDFAASTTKNVLSSVTKELRILYVLRLLFSIITTSYCSIVA
jgi:hypothetical protein